MRILVGSAFLVTAAACVPAPDAVVPVAPTRTVSAALEDLLPPEAEDLDPADGVVRVELRAQQLEDGRLGYNGSSPGPTIRLQRGDRLVVDFENELDSPTTIHWHGLHVPFDMDGVTWMGDPVSPADSFRYEFNVDQSGTYWYHPHFNTDEQVDRGLFGAIVVEDPADPVVDHDIVLLFDAEEETAPGLPHRASGHGRLNTRWLVNGQPEPTITLPGGSVVRARFINVSNAGYLDIESPGRQVGSDQGILSGPNEDERIVLAPSDRADFEWLVGADGFVVSTTDYSLNGGPSGHHPDSDLFSVEVDSQAAAPAAADWPMDGAAPSADPRRTDIVYVFQGSDRTGEWRINGEKFPDVTIREVALGETIIVELRNLSPTEHPFHLHGLPFEVLSRNGVAPSFRTIEDSVNVRIRETVRLRVHATNPGDWMAHCHILPHAEDGMMTVLRVLAP